MKDRLEIDINLKATITDANASGKLYSLCNAIWNLKYDYKSSIKFDRIEATIKDGSENEHN